MSQNNSEDEFASVSSNEIARVSVKVPPFWKTNPILWFKQVERQFITAGITTDSTKFHTIVGSIASNILSEVSDIILQPPESNMYETLKKRIQESFTDSEEKRFKKLLRDIELGDRKPSTLLREMTSLSSGKVSEDLLKNLWMQRLPKQMQAIISVSGESLNKLALMADKIADTSESWEINSMSTSTISSYSHIEKKIDEITKRIEVLTRNRSNSRSRNFKHSQSRRSVSGKRNKPYCWYHFKFGEKATKCVQPCNFPISKTYISENH